MNARTLTRYSTDTTTIYRRPAGFYELVDTSRSDYERSIAMISPVNGGCWAQTPDDASPRYCATLEDLDVLIAAQQARRQAA